MLSLQIICIPQFKTRNPLITEEIQLAQFRRFLNAGKVSIIKFSVEAVSHTHLCQAEQDKEGGLLVSKHRIQTTKQKTLTHFSGIYAREVLGRLCPVPSNSCVEDALLILLKKQTGPSYSILFLFVIFFVIPKSMSKLIFYVHSRKVTSVMTWS